MSILLQINTVVNHTSTGKIAEEIGRQSIQSGWESYIAYGRNLGNQKSKSKLIKIGDDFDNKCHFLQTRIFDRHGLGSVNATKRLLDEIIKIAPDVIHLHNIHGYYLNYKILFNFLSKSGIPVVWTLHDCWAFTGHCAHFTFIQCESWRYCCKNCPQKNAYPSSYLFDRSEQNFHEKKDAFLSVDNMTIVPVSNWLLSEVERSFLNRHMKQRIYNGVDTNRFAPTQNIKERLGVQDKFLILGVSSIWNERKGLNEFIKLAKVISKNEVIILVGLNKTQLSGLPSNIIGVSKIDIISDLVELYSSADVYISFSLEETFGLTIAESLSCGTPAIVYNSTACPEIVCEETGFVVSPHDLNTVINIINHLKSVDKNEYSYTCRKRAISFFNKNKCYENYINLYNKLLQK